MEWENYDMKLIQQSESMAEDFTTPPELIKELIRSCRGDAELIWLGIANGQYCVAIEPAAPEDQAVARRIGLQLLPHLGHLKIPWVEIYRNLNEES